MPVNQCPEPTSTGVVLTSGVVDPSSDVGIAGNGGIGCSSPAGGRAQAWCGFVEQPHSASVKARAARGKALDFTYMLPGLVLTVGLFGSQARLQGVAARLGLLEAIQRGLRGLAFTGGLLSLERGDLRCATVLRLFATGQPPRERREQRHDRKKIAGHAQRP